MKTRELNSVPEDIDALNHPEVKKHMDGLHRALTTFTGYLPDMSIQEFMGRMQIALGDVKYAKMIEDTLQEADLPTEDPRAYRAYAEETDQDMESVENEIIRIRQILGSARVLGVNCGFDE